MEFRELECFVVLSEELHFARAAERLYLSPGRVSQLVRALETRVGARLFDRTSRRVRLTPLGERFLADLRPAYEGLGAALTRARSAARLVEGVLRVGFLGTPTEVVTSTVREFERRNPACEVELVEVPMADPFGKLRVGRVDVSFTLLPVDEPDLETGAGLNKVQMQVALSPRHPLADRARIEAEELAQLPLVGLDDPAPRRWRELVAPTSTPMGRPIPSAGTVSTSQEGLTQVALNRGAMLFCTPTAAYHGRDDVTFVPVAGLPDSVLGLVWRKEGETAAVRAFQQAGVDHE
ncbi:LysR family transcriptional regulator [Nonomuraea dietziae]|uniref:DNA-binding transcriptional LysR family regulator n=1 Tax=Nonomuraea dietziae TaxID=65515 RepID=A0A7W5VCB7_9ACTN|nr:LysR family transcriptional regulator [Nonomuraea dietziae]MBB3731015.1 DNA-binding transcriptional LysR family regulator [Nonomuraea dietziae]